MLGPRFSFFVQLALAASLLSPAPPPALYAQAENLKEFMESKAFRGYQRSTTSTRALHGPKWFKPGSNFQKVFLLQDGASLLLEWLGVSAVSLTPGKTVFHKKIEYSGAEKQFVNSASWKITLAVYVPHPKFRATRQTGLLEPFNLFQPPKMEVVYTQKLDIKGLPAIMYEKPDGSCSLFIEANKGAIVNIAAERCEPRADLLSLAQALDLARLNDKLDT